MVPPSFEIYGVDVERGGKRRFRHDDLIPPQD